MIDNSLFPEGIEISDGDLANAPPAVLRLLFYLLEENLRLKKRIEELEAKLKLNSSNSNRPPSSDSPFDKPKKGPERKKNRRKGHKGYRQKLLLRGAFNR
jgi:transposase